MTVTHVDAYMGSLVQFNYLEPPYLVAPQQRCLDKDPGGEFSDLLYLFLVFLHREKNNVVFPTFISQCVLALTKERAGIWMLTMSASEPFQLFLPVALLIDNCPYVTDKLRDLMQRCMPYVRKAP
jgi:hypothetical protein